ncbi:tRNA modification GTPase TrmE [Coniophora puteana RWD-64-598 SS2]|uniref:tRNA modification GTPase TrmE n=1 Tax=Coniophora puteana (strain RWD-64-598) TaxID=741705 RepID=A0A5M3MTW2_CONPW|nr:tRNA modification GTPase TrmE [Coniophora puteana RWD-64-598 SS2]EIW82184.1 tRNA modification GTPase TrmE [Coniophora puteana RWD-64-598 SS2]
MWQTCARQLARTPALKLGARPRALPLVLRRIPLGDLLLGSGSPRRCLASYARARSQHIQVLSHFTAQGSPPLSESQRQTIYALSTPFGKGGVAVIRVSGPDALKVRGAICRPVKKAKGAEPPRPWVMERCQIVHPVDGRVLDDGLAVYFKGPKSFTTEDVLELHLHSGRAIISGVLNALSALPCCRPAEAGEFTRRAFEGGRLDLTQVEGLKDLINAETEAQRRMALEAAGGVARSQFESLRTKIIKCQVFVEGFIDFGEDVDELGQEHMLSEAKKRAQDICHEIQNHLNDNRRGEILRSGIRLAIFGPPNAGKSSLLNFLAQREAAIVTPIPGTTRDVLELTLDLGGLPVIVADTAGIRKTSDLVESVGIERAQNFVKGSDVSICLLSLEDLLVRQGGKLELKIPPNIQQLVTPTTFFLLNKSDLIGPLDQNQVKEALTSSGFQDRAWTCSLMTNTGTKAFLDGLTRSLHNVYVGQDEITSSAPLITHARHRHHLEKAVEHLQDFLRYPIEQIDIAAEELRYAAAAIGKVSGLIDVEDMLDVLFRDFCIGK